MFAVDKIDIIIEDSLYAIRYVNANDEFENNEFIEDHNTKNEFDRLFNNWQDTEYLYNFFSKNKDDLESDFYNYTIEEAVLKTIDEAYSFLKKLVQTAEKGKEDITESLQTLFSPLYNREQSVYPIPDHQKSKAYGGRKSWLRIYGIRIAENVYVITGGGIKLTRTMNEREHLRKELTKIHKVKEFLISIGIIDNDDLVDYIKLEF